MNKLTLVIFFSLLFCVTNASGETKESREKASHGINLNENITWKESKYTATVTDLSCDNVFESVSYVDNVAQLLKLQVAGMASNKDVKSGLVSVSRQMVWAPRWLEEKYAEKLHKDRLDAGDLVEDTSQLPAKEQVKLKQVEEVLKRIVDNLPSDSDYTFQLFVSRDPSVNAYAIPAGYIYITRDTLKKNNLDMIAFMLAHEVAHVTKRHQVKEFQVRLTDGMTGLSDIREIISGSGDPASLVGAMRYAAAVKNLLDNYSIAQESEADGCAVKLLANQNGIDIRKGVLGFLGKEKGLSLQNGKAQSHPTYPNRQQLIFAAYSKFSNIKYVGDKSYASGKSDGGAKPLQAASEKNSKTNTKPEQTGGVTGWLSGVGDSIGSAFSSSSKSQEPEKNNVKDRGNTDAN